MTITMKEIFIWKHNNNSYKRVLRKISDKKNQKHKHRATKNQPKKRQERMIKTGNAPNDRANKKLQLHNVLSSTVMSEFYASNI